MTIQEWAKNHQKELQYGGIGFLAGLILVALCFYTQRPSLIDPPHSTKEAKVTLHGKAAPHRGIAVFDKAGNALVIVQTNDNGEFTLSDVPIGEGKNKLMLRALASHWRVSFPLTIEIEKDTTAPALSVNSLAGATVTGSNTVLSGKAEPGSSVTVNGVKATVNPDGTWSTTVALQPGTNKITLAATDPAGNITTDTQTIQYAPTATGSQTGTATVTSSTTSTSPGSLPAPTETTPTGTTTTSTATTSPTSSSAPTPAPAPAPAPQPVLAIVATTYVSNYSPNSKANETIYASVKDNYGRPVTGASVIALVHYKMGTQAYSLNHIGNGLYSVSFKLNDKYVSGYRVVVDVTASFGGFTSTAQTSFTPL